MNKMKKFITVLVILNLIISNSVIVYAADMDSENDIISTTLTNDCFCNIDTDDYNYVNIIKVDNINEENLDTVKEIIDNGTSFFVTDESQEKVLELFDEPIEKFDGNGLYLGSYVQSYGSDYMVIPIVAKFVESDGLNVDASELNADIELNELYMEAQNDIFDIAIFEKLNDSQKAKLQSSSPLGNSFLDKTMFNYFYKEGTAGGTGTTYKYSSSSSLSGWSKLGSIRILACAIAIKTVGTKTYDNIYTKVTASGLNDKGVIKYTYNMKPTSTNTSILDESYLNGDTDSRVTTTIASGISSDGKNTITSKTSYSYNPGDQSISNQFGERGIRTWVAQPNSRRENASWIIEPTITVVNSYGTTNATTVRLYVSTFVVAGSVRSYTITNDAYMYIGFKNHTNSL